MSTNITTPIPAAAYLRYSSHNQTEQSIEGQRMAAEQFAATHGYKIIKEYIDREQSGRTDNREQFQQMLSDAPKGAFKAIIIWKIDRFGRNRQEIALNKYHCKKHGVKIEYVAENIPDSPEGVILESVLEGFAEYYSLQLSQNIKRGQLKSAEKCQVTGGSIPLGYKTNSEHKFIIDPETAPLVVKIYEMVAEGHSVSEVALYLNQQGYRTRRGTKFTVNSIYSVLRNKKYIGIYNYQNKVIIKDGVPRIISDELFERAQNAKKQNQRTPAKNWSTHEYILTGKIFCGKCGAPMRGDSCTNKIGKKFYYYSCSARKRFGTCTKHSESQSTIENLVTECAIGLLKDDNLLNFLVDKTWKMYASENWGKNKIETLTKQIASTDAAIDNLIRAMEQGVAAARVSARINELTKQKSELEASLAEIKIASSNQISKEDLQEYLYGFRNLDYSNKDILRKLIGIFINSVYVFDDKIVINFNYSANNGTITLEDLRSAESEAESVRSSYSELHQK